MSQNASLSRKLRLSFEKDGYKTISMRLSTTLEPWFWGNIVIGGLFGSTTDGLSGAVHEYAPSQYFVTLPPLEADHFNSSLPERSKAKEFIVVAYSNIMSDLQTGNGEYLTSLFNVLKIDPSEEEQAVKKIKALADIYTDIPTFAERVVELYFD